MKPRFLLLRCFSAPLKNMLLAISFAIALLSFHSRPAGAQTTGTNQTAPAPASAKPASSASEPALPSFARREEDLPKGSAPRTGLGRLDLSGYWVASLKDKPMGNIGKDLPGYKLPFTEAGRAALKYNIEHTIDPESLCIVGRHSAP